MSIPSGIFLLTLDDHSGDEARQWLDDHRGNPMLPPYYAADNILIRHLDRAVRSVSQFLSQRRHTNADTGTEFCGVVYLADNSTVKAYSFFLDRTHVVVIGAQWLFRLVKICDLLSDALDNRPRTGSPTGKSTEHAGKVPELSALLSQDIEVPEAEAMRIAAAWPSPADMYTEQDLGPWAVFYDLVRLVWLHELAHALCGHIAFARDHLGLFALYESPANGRRVPRDVDGPASEVQQCLEMHADEFAVRSSLGEILYGHDPAGLMVMIGVDLGDRLLHLNTAFCVFALLWELDERRSTQSPVAMADRSHPPVDLRYDRFRGFQRQFAFEYSPELGTQVDTLSFGFLDVLTAASGFFADLYRLTPLMFRTPDMDEAEDYERHLMRLEPAIGEQLEVHGYIPAEFLGN